MYQRVFFGPVKHAENEDLKDLNLREIVVFVPILAMIVFMGVYPKPFLSRMEPSVKKFVAHVTETREALRTKDAMEEIVVMPGAGGTGPGGHAEEGVGVAGEDTGEGTVDARGTEEDGGKTEAGGGGR
jgi:NADH-quinone oxidoreductase subunit M